MKKLFTFFTLLACAFTINAQIEYYVSGHGSNENNGEKDYPFASLSTALAACVTQYTTSEANNDFIIHVLDTITAPGQSSVAIDPSKVGSKAVNILIKGLGPEVTAIQRVSDEDYSTTTGNYGRLLQLGATATGLSISFEDLTLKNQGFQNTNGGVIANVTAKGIHVAFKNCVFYNLKARSGAVIQMYSDGGSFTADACTFYNITNINNSAQGPALNFTMGNVFITNCEFFNIIKDFTLYGAEIKNAAAANVLGLVCWKGNVYAEVTNNTFYNNKVVNADPSNELVVSTDQPLVIINDTIKSEYTFNGYIYNNLMIDNSANDVTNDLDVKIITFNSDNIINQYNVLNRESGMSLGNLVDPTFTYTSDEIDFEMNGDVPALYRSSTGVLFSKPHGTNITWALDPSDKTPAFDIEGNERPTESFSIGAYEASFYAAPVVSISPEKISATNVYVDGNQIVVTDQVSMVTVFSTTGQLVKQANTNTITVNNRGLYIVLAQLENGQRISSKVLIK